MRHHPEKYTQAQLQGIQGTGRRMLGPEAPVSLGVHAEHSQTTGSGGGCEESPGFQCHHIVPMPPSPQLHQWPPNTALHTIPQVRSVPRTPAQPVPPVGGFSWAPGHLSASSLCGGNPGPLLPGLWLIPLPLPRTPQAPSSISLPSLELELAQKNKAPFPGTEVHRPKLRTQRQGKEINKKIQMDNPEPRSWPSIWSWFLPSHILIPVSRTFLLCLRDLSS